MNSQDANDIKSGEVVVLGAGPNTIRLCPPLVITKDQADFAAQTIEECLRLLT